MVTSTWVYTPKSGTINKQIELAEKFAEIWKKYGAKEVNLYALSGAQMGNLAFTARFENAAAWGSAWDEVNQDEDFSEFYKFLEELDFNWVSHITKRQLMYIKSGSSKLNHRPLPSNSPYPITT